MENGRGQNSHSTNPAWEHYWNTTAATGILLDHRVCCGSGPVYHPDPHLMCLKLGKRHYFEDTEAAPGGPGKRGRAVVLEEAVGGGVTTAAAAVARCQVEGCHVALVNAREYHRRHKVCEMHSKAPKVVVLGLEQRFCQQCSRFHVVAEFDEAKRSCRRRLAGHNERRRKSASTHDHSLPRNPISHENRGVSSRFPYLSSSSTGRVLSLLSTPSSLKQTAWTPPSHLSSQCSAALRELIEENRASTTTTTAAAIARSFLPETRDLPNWHHQNNRDHSFEEFHASSGSQHEPSQYGFNEGATNLTLDLMQPPSSAFGFLSVREKSSEDEEGCAELWTNLGGAHVD